METKKYQLIKRDYIDIRHPETDRIVRLYRVISMKEFFVPGWGRIEENEIGGFVENESNLSHEGSAWITHTAKVFDTACVQDMSLVRDDAAVYGNAKICGNSVISDLARVRGHARIIDSNIRDKSDVRGTPVLKNVTMRNSSLIYESPEVSDTTLYDGALIHGSATVKGSVLKDVSEVRLTALVENCKLSGRAIVEYGDHRNETMARDITLEISTGKGELR